MRPQLRALRRTREVAMQDSRRRVARMVMLAKGCQVKPMSRKYKHHGMPYNESPATDCASL